MSNNYIYTNTTQTESNTTMENNNSIGYVEQVSMSFEKQRELLDQLKAQDTEIQELRAKALAHIEAYEHEKRNKQRVAGKNNGLLVAARELFEEIRDNGDLDSYTSHLAAFVGLGMDPFTKVITVVNTYTVTVTGTFTVAEDFDEDIEMGLDVDHDNAVCHADDFSDDYNIDVECDMLDSEQTED